MAAITVGRLVREPGVVSLPCAVNVTRGQLVSFTVGTGGANGTVKIPAATTDRIYGIALSDFDATVPSDNNLSVAVFGGYTFPIQPTAGQTFQQGQLVYQDQTAFNTGTTAVTASKILGWVTSQQPDAQGNYELAMFTILET